MHLVIKNLFQYDETQVLIAGVAKLIFIVVMKLILAPIGWLSVIVLLD